MLSLRVFMVAFVVGIFSSAYTAPITWGPVFNIVTDADISQAGVLVEAANVGGDKDIEVTIGAETINFVSKFLFSTPTDGLFYEPSTGNANLDVILDSHSWVSGANISGAFTLEDLEEGLVYQIQLIAAADTRECCGARAQTADDGLGNISGEMWRNGVGSVIGTFVADATGEQIINISGPYDPGLSAYILRHRHSFQFIHGTRVIVEDPFNDGDIGDNVNGKGNGHKTIPYGEKKVEEIVGGPATWGTGGEDWSGYQLHSLDDLDFLGTGGIGTFSWEVGNVEITTDNPDGPDYRIYLGVLPAILARQGEDSADLWYNTSGGVFLLIEFDSAEPEEVELQLFGVKNGKTPESFPPNNNGSSTLTWNWVNELAEISVDLDDKNVIVKLDGIEVISNTWANMGITPGGIGGLFEAGGWGFHLGSNYASGRGGHELHSFKILNTATKIPLANPSFELPGTGKQQNWENVPGWSSDSVATDSGVETGFTPTDGSWTAFLKASDPSVYQLTNHTISIEEVFELIVDARVTWGSDIDLKVNLYYNDSGSRVILATETFRLSNVIAEYSIQFDANSVPASIGKKIGIEFDNASSVESWLGLDNVRMSVEYPSRFIRGDSIGDGGVDISDVIKTIFDLFINEGKPACQDASDSNDDGDLDLSDAINTLKFLFLEEGNIPSPGPESCGFDSTKDDLDCRSYPVCCSPCAQEDFDFRYINAQGYPEYVHEKTGIIFVLLPGGTFNMGSPDTEPQRSEAEGPVHEVTLSPFLIAKYEVTQAQWEAVMGSNPSRFDGTKDSDGNPIDPPFNAANLPVEQVSWDDIQEFEARTGLILPTEAQWEYACRAGTTGPYAGSGVLDDMGWCLLNSGKATHQVGQKKPNAFGIYDMHGNVLEWCEDVYDGRFYSNPEASGLDPICASGSGYRVFRGGCWYFPDWFCRSAFRDRNVPRLDLLGFRPSVPSP